MKFIGAAAALVGASSASITASVPAQIKNQLPSGYSIMSSAKGSVGGRTFFILALHSRKEAGSREHLSQDPDRAPKRPLVIYERRGQAYVLVGRNDNVIDRAGDAGLAGNGCDPFEDGRIEIKDPYFTIENGVACGAHWTNFVTFRFDPRWGWVFDNSRFQSWKLNPSNDPSAEALIPDAPQVKRGSKSAPVFFAKWRPS
jgi:hypothetical protein